MKYIVRTCEGREDYAAYLKKHIPDLIECRDYERDPMGNFVKALKAAGDDSCVHLEDDAILTKDFINKAGMVISTRPGMVIQFFSMRKADIEIGSRVERGASFMATVCFYMPKKMSKGLLAYFPSWERREQHPTGFDLTVADYLKKTRQKYYIHCPNLVDHRVGKSEIDSRRSTKRVSVTFQDPIDFE
tara:strand:- start:4901 stop:5464 length:564 start_codon:yes stop_codon:yes gene_type:complete